ncbi:Mitochondrial fission 1 protein A, partial [Linum perenne]
CSPPSLYITSFLLSFVSSFPISIHPSSARKYQREYLAMEAKLGKFFESVTTFFSGGDQIPWCDRDIVAGCEQEVQEAEKGSNEELKNECIMRLSWALVHSKQPEDVQRGIAMLEIAFAASLGNTTSPLKQREKLYLLAIGYFRSSEYSRSREVVEECLKVYSLPLCQPIVFVMCIRSHHAY